MMIIRLSVCLLAMSLVACQSLDTQTNRPVAAPKNIILFIGDGMGPSYMKAYRMYRDDPTTTGIETTLFDSMLVGTVRTDPAGASVGIIKLNKQSKKKAKRGAVTDSAAAASAYATGKKVFNGELSIDENNFPLLTVLEKAKQLGKSTGLVVTSPLYGATPAAFATHSKSRHASSNIADQYLDNRFNNLPYVDVLLGGGKKHFVRGDRDISKEFQDLGYDYVESKLQLEQSKNQRILGLFADIELEKMMDRGLNTPSLADMTRVALEKLSSNPKGFFLMIEGSQIDWAGHRQDIVGVLSEMRDFELAVAVAKEFADSNLNTQIIITADHETGGLSIGGEFKGKKKYQWRSDVARSFNKTPEKIIKLAAESGDLVAEFQAATSMQLNDDEISELRHVYLTNLSQEDHKETTNIMAVLTKIINERSYTGWTTHGHTGTDVYLYAYGLHSDRLVGSWDNTKIGKIIFEWLDK